MQILLIGRNGQVSTKLIYELRSRNISFNNFSRSKLDLSSSESIKNFLNFYSTQIDNNKKQVIINAAAYTNVEKAEDEEDLVMQVNGYSQELLSDFAYKNNATYVYYSTDYVFDGSKKSSYLEDDATNPLNKYGKSKELGEKIIRENTDNYLILRTSWVFSENGTNFVKKIRELILSRDEISVINDQIGCPTSAKFIAEITLDLLRNREKWADIINIAQPEPVSWYDFACEIKKLYQACNNVLINSVKSESFRTKAIRPKNSVLQTNKLQSIFEIKKFRSWREDLAEILESLK